MVLYYDCAGGAYNSVSKDDVYSGKKDTLSTEEKDSLSSDDKDGLREKIYGLRSKEVEQFMKTMKKFPSVLRTEYVYQLLCEDNPDAATEIKETFDNQAKTYPYQSDIESERELIEIADKLYKTV